MRLFLIIPAILSLSFSVTAHLDSSVKRSISKRKLPRRTSFSDDFSLNATHRELFEDQPDLRKRDGTKYVFMHHIVGNTYNYDSNAWTSDFTQMLAKKIDAVALNIGSDSWQLTQITTAYTAAAAVGMKVFISFDYTAFPCDVSQTVSYVNQFKSKSSQFTVNGSPMISSYSGYCLGTSGWQSIKNQTSGYLMPFFYGQDDNTLRSTGSFGFLDSWYCWGCAWPQGDYDKNTDDDNYYIGILGTRYATTVSAWFYTHYTSKNFYLRGDDWLIVNRWEQLIAMRSQLTFVEMVTWNDFGESDYFGPLTAGVQPTGTTWATGFPHTGFFELSAYYIQAFKTGSYPQITQDVIYFWSRPHPYGITANNDPLPKPTGWNWTSDYLWAVAFCSSNCSVTLQVGSYSQDFNNLGYGVNKLQLPLNSYGSVTVQMRKNGQQVINYTPSDFQYKSSTDTYNYNAYVGYASATASASSSTPTSTSTSTSNSTSTRTSTSTSAASTATSAPGYIGCMAEGTTGTRRALTGANYTSSTMTPAKCQSLCAGFTYAGVEYGDECYCGNTLTNNGATGVIVSDSQCTSVCAGDSTKKCGGAYMLSLYYTNTSTGTSSSSTSATSSSSASSSTSRSATSSISATSSTSATSSSSASSATSTTFSLLGCVAEGTTGTRRALTAANYTDSKMTPALCQSKCAGYTYAGVEYSTQCYCGNSLTNNGASGAVVNSPYCSMNCAGDSSQKCGGAYFLTVYTTKPTAASWTSQGCYIDKSTRILQGVFLDGQTGMTTESCISTCSSRGYSIAGTEYGHQCMCGNSLVNASSTASSDCNIKCDGNSSEICGGSYRANIYTAPGTILTKRHTKKSFWNWFRML